MTAKARPVRRSRPSFAARLRTYWVLGVLLAGLIGWGGWTLATWPGFHLHTLTVTGLSRVARREVVARAAIDAHANVWLLDRTAIERRIGTIPYVDTARVHRRPLAMVWIEVAERTVEACVRDAARHLVTVDRDLRVLASGCARGTTLAYDVRSRVAARPGDFLHDAELARLQRDARALAAAGDRFGSLGYDAFGALEATLYDGIKVRFGDDADLAVKQRLIGPILAQLGRRTGDVRAVDLRAPATPVVEYRR